MKWRLSLISQNPIFSSALMLGLALVNLLPIHAETINPVSPNLTQSPEVKLANYQPPKDIGTPPTEPAGTRGNCSRSINLETQPQNTSLEDNISFAEENRLTEERNPVLELRPVMPALTSKSDWGLTVKGYPEFFVYVPPTNAKLVEFALQDDEGNEIYKTTFPISGEAGIISYQLPESIEPLEIGKQYQWFFSLICDSSEGRPNDSLNDTPLYTFGWTRRVEMNSTLANWIKTAKSRDRANIYAENGIWHEALATLAELRRQNPNDITLAREWENLLRSAGLEEIIEYPILINSNSESPIPSL